MKKIFFVKKNHEFQKIIKKNNQFFFNNFILFISENNYGYTRFGLSVGKKKYKLAVVRNKIKRQLRHILRMYYHYNDDFFNLSIDVIIIFKYKNYDNCKFIDIKNNLFKPLDFIYRKQKNKNKKINK